MDKPFLSQSKLDSYSRCGEAFRRRYVEGEIIPPPIAMARGRGVHKGAEYNHAQKVESHIDLPKKEIVEVAVSEYETIAKEIVDEPKAEIKKGKDGTATLSALYADSVAPLIQPAFVEHTIEVDFGIEYNLKGTIDVATTDEAIIDLKTASKKWTQEDADRSLQAGVYSVLYTAEQKHPPKAIMFDVLVDKQESEHQRLLTKRDEKDTEVLANRMGAMIAGLKAGTFMPAPANAWWCSEKFCGYWRTCKYVKKGGNNV